MKWMLLFVIAVLNILAIGNVFLPSVTDWAVTAPPGISCNCCTSQDGQKALADAAKAGRDPFIRGMQFASYWLFGVFFVNVAFMSYLIAARKNHQRSMAG